MLEKIIERLKHGIIKNVIFRGYGARPNPPYIVVDLEGQELRVWTHFENSSIVELENFCRVDLAERLNDYQFETSSGNTVRIQRASGELPGYGRVVLNDDKTISKERRWTVPGLLF